MEIKLIKGPLKHALAAPSFLTYTQNIIHLATFWQMIATKIIFFL